MAAAPLGGAAGLGGGVVPAPFTASFATLFNDASTDPTAGDINIQQAPFVVNLVDQTDNVDSTTLKNRLAASGESDELMGVTISSGGKSRAYISPFRYGSTINNVAHQDMLLGFEGEVVGNNTVVSVIPPDVFHLPTNTIMVATVPTILAALAANPALPLMGPWANTDANVEGRKVRRVVPIPHFLVPNFLAKPDGITPQYFFLTLYPLIVGQNEVPNCQAIIEYFQVAMTATAAGPSWVDTARPVPPPRDEAILRRMNQKMDRLFPELRHNPRMGQNQIAQGLGLIAHQQYSHYEERKREREDEKRNPVERFFGEENMPSLCRLTQTLNERELSEACPVYPAVAKATKAQRQMVLQSFINKELVRRDERYLSVIVSPGILANWIGLSWHRTNSDSVDTGFLANLFLWGGTDVEQQQATNREAQMAMEGGIGLSPADAKEILKVKVNPPIGDKSLDNLKRLDVICSVVLPPEHTFGKFVKDHLKAMTGYWGQWEKVETENPANMGAKAIMHCQLISLRGDTFWKNQLHSNEAIVMPSPTDMIDTIENGGRWEPRLSTTFKQKVNYSSFCAGGASRGREWDDRSLPSLASTLMDSLSTLGNRSAASEYLASLGIDMASLSASGGGGTGGRSGGGRGGGGGDTDNPNENGNFNLPLFGTYKTRKVDGKIVKSKAVRDMIAAGELPSLPLSKVPRTEDPKTMCLAWHTKGMCYVGCPHNFDHIKYTVAEYAPLKAWCEEHYPKAT